jgi:2-amino-4-hydroxy-6-hydroxymethyldihydropteridine diphosphokinase
MAEVLVGIGSNQDPLTALRDAVAALAGRYGRVACSAVYRSRAVGPQAPDYLNMVVRFATDLDVDVLEAELADIETAAGRTRDDPRVCRLDLDLLTYGWRVDASRRLPRPGLFALPFVLVPLAEIGPELAHPLTGQRCAEARSALAGAAGIENLGTVG